MTKFTKLSGQLSGYGYIPPAGSAGQLLAKASGDDGDAEWVYKEEQTAAELAAGVTPSDYSFDPGDPRRYGASATAGESANVTALQAALDSNNRVILPELYPINAALNLNDGNHIAGFGRNTGLVASHVGAILRGKSVTTAATTNVRRYNVGGDNFKIVGPGRTNVGSVGLDMRGVTMAKWWGLLINDVERGVYQGDGYSSYYNEYHGVDISTVVTGYENTTLGNENKVFGGRVNDSTVGTNDDDCSGNRYFGLAVEVFSSIGHRNSNTAAATNIGYVCSRLENVPTAGIGIQLGATAQVSWILFPQFTGLSTNISNSSSDANIWSDTVLVFAGGSSIRKHTKTTASIDFPSIAGGATNDQLVTISGVVATDSVFVTPPDTLPAGIVLQAIPAAGGVYVRAANVTALAVDVSALTYIIDIWKHN